MPFFKMSRSLEELSKAYAELISKIAISRPCHRALCEFTRSKQMGEMPPTRLELITFPALQTRSRIEATQNVEFKSFKADELEEELKRTDKLPENCRLFIIENLSPRLMCVLGGYFDIDTKFFADHVNPPSWRRLEDVNCKISALPSAQGKHDFLHMNHFQPRTIRELDVCASNPESEKTKTRNLFCGIDPSRVRRGASVLKPRSRRGQNFNVVLIVRQAATVYFKCESPGNSVWVG